MTEFELSIEIGAPTERCFDLARSMDFHQFSMRATGERIVSGRKSGLIDLHESVEFEARHLGLTRRLLAEISDFDRPRSFADRQMRGPFRSFRHLHRFEETGTPDSPRARMSDHIQLDIGWSVFGLAAERLLVAPHLRQLLRKHQQHLKAALESDQWRAFLKPA